MNINEQEHEKKREMIQELGKILPETINKVEHYRETIIAEGELLNLLQKRQSNPFVFSVTKANEKCQIVELKNSIFNKQKIYESYLGRKKRYETFLDEMTIEVLENFDKTLDEAKKITSNVRLVQTIKKWEEESTGDIQEKIEFYLYLNQEILNYQKHNKKK